MKLLKTKVWRSWARHSSLEPITPANAAQMNISWWCAVKMCFVCAFKPFPSDGHWRSQTWGRGWGGRGTTGSIPAPDTKKTTWPSDDLQVNISWEFGRSVSVIVYFGETEVEVSLQGTPLSGDDLVKDWGQQEGEHHSQSHEEEPSQTLLGVVAVVLALGFWILLPQQQPSLKMTMFHSLRWPWPKTSDAYVHLLEPQHHLTIQMKTHPKSNTPC